MNSSIHRSSAGVLLHMQGGPQWTSTPTNLLWLSILLSAFSNGRWLVYKKQKEWGKMCDEARWRTMFIAKQWWSSPDIIIAKQWTVVVVAACHCQRSMTRLPLANMCFHLCLLPNTADGRWHWSFDHHHQLLLHHRWQRWTSCCGLQKKGGV